MNGPIGAGVKHTIKITSATAARISRPRSSGSSSSRVGGCRGPIVAIITSSNTVQAIQLDETNVRPMATPIITMVMTVERRPNTA